MIKHSQIRLYNHLPYIATNLHYQFNDLIPQKTKNILSQINKNPEQFKLKETPNIIKIKQKRKKQIRESHKSEMSEHLPKMEKFKKQQNLSTFLSDRNSVSLYKSSANTSQELVQKYSIFAPEYHNGISSGKKVEPTKLQKRLWKQTLDYLLKCHQN